MSRYTKQHYEDVARTLKEQATYYSGIVNDGQAIVAGVVLGRTIEDFADLFAADNPPACQVCGYTGTTGTGSPFCCQSMQGHNFKGGFDGKQFLEACGLEPQSERSYSDYVAGKIAGEFE